MKIEAVSKKQLDEQLRVIKPDQVHCGVFSCITKLFPGLDIVLTTNNSYWSREIRLIDSEGNQVA